jgi:hypothetical protein
MVTMYGADDKLSKAGDTATGPIEFAGSPPMKLPSGTAGDVLTSDASGNLTLQPASGGPSLPLSIANGGTGSTSASAARTALGLGTSATENVNTTAGTIAALGSQAAGSSGQVADAGHVHPTTGLVLSSSLPLAIGSGGTGQTAAAAAFNALSPMTTLGDLEYESGAATASRLAGNTTTTKKFLTQTGTGSVSAAPGWNTIASGDLPTASTSAQGAVELDGTAGDIQPYGVAQSAGSTGKAADAGHGHAANIYVPTASATVTGVTAITKLCDGLTIASGALAAGQVYRFNAWGTITTTVDTQTVKIGLYLGGITGTDLLDWGNSNPDSSATVSAVAWSASFEVVMLSSTSGSTWGWVGLNYFFSNVNQSTVTVSNGSAQELVIGVTPSASALSITAKGWYCQRVA